MASSVITMFKWSILRTSSAVLILLWAFNPLGSQASLRSVYLKPRTSSSQGYIEFSNANVSAQMELSSFSTAVPIKDTPSIVTALYSSSLHSLTSSLQYVDLTNRTAVALISALGGESTAGIEAAADNWGNVRIPNLKYLPDYSLEEPHKWLNTPWDEKILNYSSLVGDWVGGVDRSFTGNTTFTIMSSYQDFSVSEPLNLISKP